MLAIVDDLRVRIRGAYTQVFQILVYLLCMGFWIALVLFATEIMLRVFVESPPSHYVYDAHWGWQPAAGSRVFWGEEGFGHTYYSAHGELATPYDNGVSVVVLGDSHTEAYQVKYQKNFVSVAETLLHRKQFDVNLHNLGKQYSAIPDYVYLAPFIQERYQPKLVVIQLSVQDFFWHEVFSPGKMNRFVNTDTALEVVHVPPVYSDHWLGRIMNNVVLLVQGTKRYRTLFTPKVAVATATDEPAITSPEVIRAQLQELKAAYADTPVVIVMLPYAPTIEDGVLVLNEPEYDPVLALVEAVDGWHVIDPSAGFQELLEVGQLPRGFFNSLPGQGHLNVYGHQIVGELLADAIIAILSEEPQP